MIRVPDVHVRGTSQAPLPRELITYMDPTHPLSDYDPQKNPNRMVSISYEPRPGGPNFVMPPAGKSHTLARVTLDVNFETPWGDCMPPAGLSTEPRQLFGLRFSDNGLSGDTKHNVCLYLGFGTLGNPKIPCDVEFSGAAEVVRRLIQEVPDYRCRSGSQCFVFGTSVQFAPQPGYPQLLRFGILVLWCDLEAAPRQPWDPNHAPVLKDLLIHSSAASQSWTFQDFYNSVHVPPKLGASADSAAMLQVPGVACKLYPFQRRTVCWLLKREGVDPELRAIDSLDIQVDHPFTEVTGLADAVHYVSQRTFHVTSDTSYLQKLTFRCSGGLLAEEMGLGKTVEVLSLVTLHQRSESPYDRKDPVLTASKATVIISPISIQQQWKSEIEMHSPHLRVMIYEGMKSIDTATAEEEKETIEEMCECDIVLVSYDVLAKEVHYTEDGPDRNMRHARKYRKPKSPLIQIDWWRCILDECQMIEGGLNKAAQVAHQIPRQYSWAVSGTPMKKDATDLTHIINFLRLQAVNNPVWWSWDLIKGRSRAPPFKPLLDQLFGGIAIRHTKEQIKDELVLPPQKRLVMTMPFTAIEEQRYADMFQEMCEDCDLSLDGAPLKADWKPEEDGTFQKMRAWLARLRQTVLHPEVGERNRRALGRSEGPLRTVAEVLKVMTEQNETATRLEERTLLNSQLKRGQILEHAKQPKEALDLWAQVFDEAQSSVKECRRELLVVKAAADPAVEQDMTNGVKKEDEDEAGEDISLSNPWRHRLRLALEVLHTATFFVANAYFQIKSNEELTKPESDEFKTLEKQEADTYEKAKQIRKELLSDTQAKASELMKSMVSRKETKIPQSEPPTQPGGFESRHVVDKADDLCDIMNKQKEKMESWREAIKKALLTALIDQEDQELQGDEYETSTKHQDEVYVYIEVLRALIADRHELLTGQPNALIEIEMRRNKEAARREEGHAPELMLKLLDERLAIAPKAFHGSFRTIITELRILRTNAGSVGSSNKRAAAEREIITMILRDVQNVIDDQTKVQNELEKELELFMITSNARLDFYRQLQSISDMVAPFEKDFEDEERERTMLQILAAEDKTKEKIQRLKSRRRYLVHLDSENESQAEPKNCIICRETIDIGVLTSCGHQFCKECLRLWWSAHKTCPVCKKSLTRDDFHQISYKPQVLSVQEEAATAESAEQHNHPDHKAPTSTAIYSGINGSTLAEIQRIDLPGSYGTKVDTLARHLLYIRRADPGAKSIIFSQFRDFLDILGRAFKRFRIGYASVDERGRQQSHASKRRKVNGSRAAETGRGGESGIERFIKDPSVECFFMHARAQAAGLNLVNATHVFLCEPLINTALELQAIARVHRIGQHQPTAVYMYLVDGTVEKAIYDISVRRRLEHVGEVSAAKAASPAKASQEQQKKRPRVEDGDDADGANEDDAAIEAANSKELQQASLSLMLARGSTGGEFVPSHDLWDCLFRVKGAAGRATDEAQRVVAGFLGGEAAEHRSMVERPHQTNPSRRFGRGSGSSEPVHGERRGSESGSGSTA